MNNVERAAEVLRGDKHYKMGPHGEQFLTSEAARSLADAGLLIPDLPESSWPNGIPTNGDTMSSLYTSGGKVYACINAGYDSDNEELTPDEAIEWAYDLIAAARQAIKEQEQDNV